MIKETSLILCLLFLPLTSCKTGSAYEPIVNNPGPNYQHDLMNCQKLSEQRKYFNGDTGVGAGAGAGLGGLTGLVLGGNAKSAVAGAALGGAFGGGSAMMQAKEEKKYIIVRCLRRLGYDIYL